MADDTATIPFAKRPSKSLTEVMRAAEQEDPDFISRAEAELREVMKQPVTEPTQPTDVQYVANALDCLRHLDLKAAVIGMLGETMPKDVNEAIDRVSEWAAANKTKVPA